MIIIPEEDIMKHYKMNDAIRDMRAGLTAKNKGLIENPSRIVIEVPERHASSLNMPSADLSNDMFAMKVVTIFPENPKIGKPTTQAVLLLSDATTGEHVSMMGASYLTRLRTGALSGIATEKLAKEDAKVLGVIGTGGMAFEQVLGVLEARPIESIILFNRTEAKAHTFKQKLIEFGVKQEITVVDDVKKVVTAADVINCATRSNDPVFDGHDLKPGTHINGVGSYLPHMREVDLTTIERSGKIVVDDLQAVKEEAGELIHAEKVSDWSFDDVYGELRDIHENDGLVRQDDEEITFFKCVGTAYFDLIVAIGTYKKAQKHQLGQAVKL